MIKNKYFLYTTIFFLLSHCSFDNKSGIWASGKKERERISELENNQKKVLDVIKIYSSSDLFKSEIKLNAPIKLTKAIKNTSWKMSSLNHQNFLGNLYLPSIENMFLKKKIGKNKSSISNNKSSPIIFENNIIFSDDKGTIYNITGTGVLNWKINIYKKIYKKIYKNLSYSIYQNNIYVSDNVGFLYSISLSNGEVNWIKNHGIPLKSNIKVMDKKIFVINQDNRLLCFSTSDGSKAWDIRSISSFIKSQKFLSLALSKEGDLISFNSSADLMKNKGSNGEYYWSLNTSNSMIDATDFFTSSNIVLDKDNIIFSEGSTFYSFNHLTSQQNWAQTVSTVGSPIIVNQHIFSITENGFFAIMKKNTGEIISSNNILKILKKKKRNTKVTGFVMGSGKLYSVTLNGYLIVSSATSGIVESFRKISDSIISPPIIHDGKLYIITKNSKILGFN